MKYLFLILLFPLSIFANSYFPKDYAEARKNFAVQRAHTAQIYRDYSFKVPSSVHNDLFIDAAYAAPFKTKENLLIISSGVHGVEAFVGSAIQGLFLNEIAPKLSTENLGILLIHSVNPFGYKTLRRVSENNVDLNRSFSINDQIFKNKNPGYAKVESVLNPQRPTDLSSLRYYFSFFEMAWLIIKHSMKPLRQAILQGQYSYPKGLYFGGQNFEPQNQILGNLFKEIAQGYRKILMIDLHTGYGKKGHLHLLGGKKLTQSQKQGLSKLFPNKTVETGADEDFYSVFGDFTDFYNQLKPLTSRFHPITFEFGTLDSQTYTGAIRSINTMIVENQGHHHGYQSTKDKETVKNWMKKMYYPEDSEWRAKVLSDSKAAIETAIKNMQKL